MVTAAGSVIVIETAGAASATSEIITAKEATGAKEVVDATSGISVVMVSMTTRGKQFSRMTRAGTKNGGSNEARSIERCHYRIED